MAAKVTASARLSGSAATGVGVWLGVVAAEAPAIGDRYGVHVFSGSGTSALPLFFSFSFSSSF